MTKGLLRSDYDIIITTPKDQVRAERTDSFFRDVRDHGKEKKFRDLDTVDWTKITNENLSSDEMTSQFYETISPKFESCFPPKKFDHHHVTRCSCPHF